MSNYKGEIFVYDVIVPIHNDNNPISSVTVFVTNSHDDENDKPKQIISVCGLTDLEKWTGKLTKK